jgi:hypothetical protein
MKTFVLLILSVFLSIFWTNLFSQESHALANAGKKKKQFNYRFRILDSAANASSSDTIICCSYSIHFMEKNTKIYGEGYITYFGKLFFTKNDLKKWHVWYNKRFHLH